MRKFKSLRLDPPERLEILKQEVVLGSWAGSSTLLLLPRCGTQATAYSNDR